MVSGTRGGIDRVQNHPDDGDAIRRAYAQAPTAIAITRGSNHTLVYANAAFHKLFNVGHSITGRPVTDVVLTDPESDLGPQLDRTFNSGSMLQDRIFDRARAKLPPLSITVWPILDQNSLPIELVLQMHEALPVESTMALQRSIAERMLLSAVRERDLAESAEESRRQSALLARTSRVLAESLDEDATRLAVSKLAMPALGVWCFVDLLGEDGIMRRLAIVHPDARKQEFARQLEGCWRPSPGDRFGLPAVLENNGQPIVLHDHVDESLAASASTAECLHHLRELGIGSMLTVPFSAAGVLLGAMTFVSDQAYREYTDDEIDLAEDMAARSAQALNSARLHSEALALKARAESASQAKSTFLANMSHELRTPLNAIGGFVEILEYELHGPLTVEQHGDLDRIRASQQHLLALINELLDFVHLGSGRVPYEIEEFSAHDVVDESMKLIEPLLKQKGLVYLDGSCDTTIRARGDREKVQQILINLLSNAIKFTPQGGSITIDCVAANEVVLIAVSDSGIGIPSQNQEMIFEAFAQVNTSYTKRTGGVGLGLAISRDLARGMHGDLDVQSTLGAGSRFTLTLPRAV